MSDTIFAADPAATEAAVAPAAAPVTTPSDPYSDLLKGIANEDGGARYATVSDALTAIPHKESHIKTLEGENADFRSKIAELSEALAKADSVDTLIDRLDTQQDSSDPTPTGITEQDILRIIGDSEKEKERNANAASVVNTLRESFGDQAETTFYAKAEELGISNDMLDDLAKASPVAALELFKIKTHNVVKLRGGSSDSLAPTPAPAPLSIKGVHTSKGLLEVWRSHSPTQE